MRKFIGTSVLLSCLLWGLFSCGGGGGGFAIGSSGSVAVWAYFDLFRDTGFNGLRRLKDPTRRPGYVVVQDSATGDRMAFHTATLRDMYRSYGSGTAREVRRIMAINGGEWASWSGRTIAEFVTTINYSIPLYEGVYSGYIYEDKESSKDVNYLRAQEESQRAVVQLVSLSERFGLSLEAAGSLVEMKNAFREIVGVDRDYKLTLEDQLALADRLQETTGLSQKELLNTWLDPHVRAETLAKAAKHLNTSEESINSFVSLFEELIQ